MTNQMQTRKELLDDTLEWLREAKAEKDYDAVYHLKSSIKLLKRQLMRWDEAVVDPIGVQLKTSGDLYAVILADASEPGRYRAQYFDAAGFMGHSTYDTPGDVLHALLIEGYINRADGALERLSQQEKWRIGVQVQHYRDAFNRGAIAFDAMCAHIEALHNSSAAA